MGSAGLQWDANDGFSVVRGNQKTTFVGTGAQINALSTTYAGQQAYCTSTGSGFTIDNVYERNAANNTWALISTYSNPITETAESNTTPITDNADFTAVAGNRYYAYHTLPTTEKFYIITGIEWKNGATVNGNVISGIDRIDANPPTIDNTPLLALGQQVAQAGTSAVQRVSIVSSSLIRGGTIIGAWVSCSSGTATLREQTGLSSQKQYKATAYNATPDFAENTVFAAAVTVRKYVKIYYRGYT